MDQLWPILDLMECLTKSSQPASIHPGIDAKVLDGAAIVQVFNLIIGVWFFYMITLFKLIYNLYRNM